MSWIPRTVTRTQETICVLLELYSEKAMAPHSSTLAWKIPWMEEPGELQSMGSLRINHNWATSLSLFTFMHWKWNGNPLQCSCLENPRDWGAWWTAVYGVAQSRTRLKRLSSSSRTILALGEIWRVAFLSPLIFSLQSLFLHRMLWAKVFGIQILDLCSCVFFFSFLHDMHIQFGGIYGHSQQTFSFMLLLF